MKRKESERHVLMLEFVRQSHLFELFWESRKTYGSNFPIIFRAFQIAILFIVFYKSV